MWNYEKRLQYPVHIKTPNAKIAKIILTQYGGPDGAMGASMRYLSQRCAMPNRIAMGTLAPKSWGIWKWYPPLSIS